VIMAMRPLGDICEVRWGDTTKTKASYVTEGFPAYSASGRDGYLPYFDHEGPGMVLSAIGAQCGKTWFATGKWSCIKNTIFLKARVADVDARYVFYATSDPTIWPKRGAAQPFISQTDARAVQIHVPTLQRQLRIVAILSAYDDLIENCERRIRGLDEMARALYREWFVLFRYPGHERVPLVSSSVGNRPEGWEMRTLGDLVQFRSGFAFKSGKFTAEGEHRLATIKNVQDGKFNPECDSRMNDLPDNLPPHCVLQTGDILLSLTGNVGRVCLVYDGPFLLNQRVSRLVPAEEFDWAIVYSMFREPAMRAKLEQLSTGVAQQNLSPVLASKMEFARPPTELRRRFATLVEPMVRRTVDLYSTISNVRKTRDLLLPRLLSGQLAAEDTA
jgi:type I restriction enzyme, S subunit